MKFVRSAILLILCLLLVPTAGCTAADEGTSAAADSQAPETAVLEAADTPSPTDTPASSADDDAVVFENENVRVIFLGVGPISEGEELEGLLFSVENRSDCDYAITTMPLDISIDTIDPGAGEMKIGDTAFGALSLGEWFVYAGQTLAFSLAPTDEDGTLLDVLSAGFAETAVLTLYFTDITNETVFDTGALTLSLPKTDETAQGAVIFENDEVTLSYLGIGPYQDGAPFNSLLFSVRNATSQVYYITTTPYEDTSGTTVPSDRVVLLDDTPYGACILENWLVLPYETAEFNVTPLSGDAISTVPDDGSVRTAVLTIYFSGSDDSFDTGELTVELADSQTAGAEATPADDAADGANETADRLLSYSGEDLSGSPVSGELFTKNKLTMVNYWATWCGYCVEEIPDLSELSEAYASQGLGVLGVLIWDDDNVSGAKQFWTDSGVLYPSIVAEGVFSDLMADQNGIPVTMFFDSQGNQVGETIVGAMDRDNWESTIRSYLSLVN